MALAVVAANAKAAIAIKDLIFILILSKIVRMHVAKHHL
jgi:hypothetical protein